MANSYISIYVHYVFSTKNRLPLIRPDMQERLWSYMGGIARNNHMKAFAVGGMEDHAHVLVSLPSTLTVSKAIQIIKGNSSKWINENFNQAEKFSWQEGYGAFSVNVSILKDSIRYIENQKKHHQKSSYKDEYIDFLKKHCIGYDEQYIWG
jgi:putative transposase